MLPIAPHILPLIDLSLDEINFLVFYRYYYREKVLDSKKKTLREGLFNRNESITNFIPRLGFMKGLREKNLIGKGSGTKYLGLTKLGKKYGFLLYELKQL